MIQYFQIELLKNHLCKIPVFFHVNIYNRKQICWPPKDLDFVIFQNIANQLEFFASVHCFHRPDSDLGSD